MAADRADNTTPLNSSDPTRPWFGQSPSPPPGDDVDPDIAPIGGEELASMRRKLMEMGFALDSKPGDVDTSEKERILVNMVLRLIRSGGTALPSQVIRQAEVISGLSAYIDFLKKQHVQERERWEAERCASSRLTDAMLKRMRKGGMGKLEELEREHNEVLSSNRVLQLRLQDAQDRLESLEAELHTLRPYFVTKSDETLGQPIQAALHASSPRTPSTDPKSSSRRDTNDGDDVLRASYQGQFLKRGHYKVPILGDARSEYMLLAARKVGRERVACMAPSVQLASSGVNMFQGMLFPVSPYTPQHVVTPQTPTGPRVTTVFSPVHPLTPSRHSLFSPTSIRQASLSQHPRPNAAANAAAVAANGIFPQKQDAVAPISPSKWVPSTPIVRRKHLDSSPGASGLESLFIAAKRVFDEDEEGQAPTPTKKRRVNTSSGVESRTPETTPNSPIETEMSALQVLAQQAVTLGSHEQDASGALASVRSPRGTVDKTVTGNGSDASERPKLPNTLDVPQTSGRTSYLKYAPDYKTRPNLGSLPPAPDYSAAFVGAKAKAKAAPLTKSASLPSVVRPSSIVNPYSPRVLNLSIRQNTPRLRFSPSRQSTSAHSSPQGRAPFFEGHATRSGPSPTQPATSGDPHSGGDDNEVTDGRGKPILDPVFASSGTVPSSSSDTQLVTGKPDDNPRGRRNGRVSMTVRDRAPDKGTTVLRESPATAIAT